MKRIHVRWYDAHEIAGWKHVDDLPECLPDMVETFGYLVKRSPAGIMVASHVSYSGDSVAACSTMFIPISAILEATIIKGHQYGDMIAESGGFKAGGNNLSEAGK